MEDDSLTALGVYGLEFADVAARVSLINYY